MECGPLRSPMPCQAYKTRNTKTKHNNKNKTHKTSERSTDKTAPMRLVTDEPMNCCFLSLMQNKRHLSLFDCFLDCVGMGSSLMRRLSRQLCAVLSVLQSCALVKLYSADSCTSFRTSSRVALDVVSWSTCCCRVSSAKASLLFSGIGASF